MAVASMVLGILAIIPLPIPFLGIICAIVGLALGVVAKKSLTEQGAPTGMATAGIVMSIIGLALSLLWLTICAALATGCAGMF